MKRRIKNKDRFATRAKTSIYRLIVYSLLSLFFTPYSIANDSTKVKTDSIYQGTQIKLDIVSPVLIAGLNNWQIQHYEMAANVRLKNRYYPTLELGYATPGGFVRVGCDINPLKKHPESPHALLVGVRIGTAVQEKGYTDCWGEIVAGCQVEVAKGKKPRNNGQAPMGFYMGWMGRFKFLFTRDLAPAYIPGYGKRDNLGWGLNYYIGWKF